MIRNATYDDLPRLMEIFGEARKIMRESGNLHQWNDSYPSEEIVRKDIEDGVCFVLCHDNAIAATMAFIPGPDPTYGVIHDGKWLDDSPYHVIHRIAAAEPGKNVAITLLDWAFTQTSNIRIDTHKDNAIMQHILDKQGFTHCGMIYLANGDPREAYQMNIKDYKYKALYDRAKCYFEGEDNLIANMANLSAMIHREFGFWWTGFYRVVGEQLVLGPFQGPTACTRIAYGKGVCGSAWKRGETIVVPDVEEFPGHIACSSESRSEIVVPLWRDGRIVAVLDIDSEKLGTFTETDKVWLERVVELI
jgi:GAF domain-containing protein